VVHRQYLLFPQTGRHSKFGSVLCKIHGEKHYTAFVKVVEGSEIYNFHIHHFVHFYSKFWSYARPNRGTVKLFQSVAAAPRRAPSRDRVPQGPAPRASWRCARGTACLRRPRPSRCLPTQLDAAAYKGSATQCFARRAVGHPPSADPPHPHPSRPLAPLGAAAASSGSRPTASPSNPPPPPLAPQELPKPPTLVPRPSTRRH
jgi:hypothetical protein